MLYELIGTAIGIGLAISLIAILNLDFIFDKIKTNELHESLVPFFSVDFFSIYIEDGANFDISILQFNGRRALYSYTKSQYHTGQLSVFWIIFD